MEEKKRIYGAWAGNPNGCQEDVTRCIQEVQESGRGLHFHQCDRKRGHGKDGLYCKQHDPEAVKAKSAAQEKKWSDESAARQRGLDIIEKRAEIVKLAQKLVPLRSFGQEFDALAKAVEELSALVEQLGILGQPEKEDQVVDQVKHGPRNL
jgi:hypothetical protein